MLLCSFLQPFAVVTDILQGEEYPTLGCVSHYISYLLQVISGCAMYSASLICVPISFPALNIYYLWFYIDQLQQSTRALDLSLRRLVGCTHLCIDDHIAYRRLISYKYSSSKFIADACKLIAIHVIGIDDMISIAATL